MVFLQTSWQPGAPQQKPKRLRLLADVSGSMYRFNGVDGRLERSMEAVCMVMEALESYEHKFKVRVGQRLWEMFIFFFFSLADPQGPNNRVDFF